MSRNNSGRLGAQAPDDNAPAAAATQQATLPTPAQAPDSNPLAFVVPTEFVELPSRGRYYPPNHVLHNAEVIEIRHMTAKDEDILTSRSLLRKGLAIDRLLQNLIVDKRIKMDDLLVGDKSAVLIAARIHAYTSEYHTQASCPFCGASGDNVIDLNEVTLTYGEDWSGLDIEGPTENNTFLITLPTTEAKVEAKLLTGADEKRVAKVLENRKRNKMQEASVTAQLKQIVVSINGHANRTDIGKFIENMPTIDSQYLRAAYNKVVPNVDMTLPYHCEECDSDSTLEVPFTAEFFWPKRKLHG